MAAPLRSFSSCGARGQTRPSKGFPAAKCSALRPSSSRAAASASATLFLFQRSVCKNVLLFAL